jgi:myo-inositol 2-dehydrogenase/D-chiro-inositol 1-dehydrogenase
VSGGLFYDMLCHDFDLLHYLSGQTPTEVFAAAHCYNPDIAAMGDVDTVAVTCVRLPSSRHTGPDTQPPHRP